MKRVSDPDFGDWLMGFAGDEGGFDWDAGNRPKLGKHNVTADEAESLFHHAYVFAGRIVEPAHDEPRWLALGETEAGRALSIIFTRRGDRLRVISCRAMRKEERKVYEQGIAEEEE